MYYGYERISLNGYHHGYQRISFFDMQGYLLPLKIFLCISFYIQQFIHRYPTFIRLHPSFYPLISIHILFFYPVLYPYISTSYPTFLYFCILLFIPFYPEIYPAGYSIRFSADPACRGVLLNRLHILLSNRVSHCVSISPPSDAAAAGSRC